MLPSTQDQQQDPRIATYLLDKKVERRIQKAQNSGEVVLDLCGLGLRTVPKSIVQLTNLQELALSKNQLTSLPDAIVQLTNLKKLYLSDNQLTSLPDAIAQLTNLQELAICNNRLTSLPDTIAHLTNLQLLALTRNRLTSLPDTIAHLTNLQLLYLSDNQLISLPNAMQQLTQLKKLHLHRNDALNILPGVLGPEFGDDLDAPQEILDYYFHFCNHYDEKHTLNGVNLESNEVAVQPSPLAASQQNITVNNHFYAPVNGVAATVQGDQNIHPTE